MNNIENSSRELNLKSERSTIGCKPQYIMPKVFNGHQGKGSEQSEAVVDSEDYISRTAPLGKIKESLKSIKKVRFIQAQEQQNNLSQSKTLQNSNHSTSLWISSVVIWFFYLTGSTQPYPMPLNYFHFIDCGGNLIAIGVVIKSLRENYRQINFVHCIHIYSAFLTGLFFSGGIVQSFLPYFNFIRALRLLFPIFLMISIQKGLSKIKKIWNLLKTPLFWTAILIIIFSAGTMQIFQGSIYNRCRETSTPISYFWPAKNSQLCGNNNCPANTFCRSPYQFSMQPLQFQLYTQKNLLNGMVQYNNIGNSLVSNFMIMSLNHWSEISEMFFNSYNNVFCMLIFGSLVIFYRISSMLIFINLFDDQRKNNTKLLEHQIELKSQSQNRQQILKDEIVKNPESAPLIQLSVNINFQKIKKKIKKNYSQFLKNVLLLVQVGLIGSFGWKQQENANRLIGIMLAIYFILWSVYIAIQLNNFLMQESHITQKELIFQFFLYGILIADYCFRFGQNLYIIQQPSAFTPFAHSIIMLRVFYVCANNQFAKFLSEFAWIVIGAFQSILGFIPIIIPLASLLGITIFYSLEMKDNNKSLQYAIQEINKSLVYLLNFSWIEIISGPNMSILKFGIITFAIIFGQLILKTLITSSVFASNLPEIQDKPEAPVAQVINQKSFNLFSTDNCLRSLCSRIVENKMYNKIRLFFIIGYCAFIFIGFELIPRKKMSIFGLVMFACDVILLVDILVEMVAKGVLGPISYTEDKPVRFINIFSTIYIIINWFTPLFPFLLRACQFCRIFLLCQYFSIPQQFATRLAPAGKMIGAYIIIVVAFVNFYNCLFVIPTFIIDKSQNSHNLARGMIKSGSIILSEKGWNWDLVFGPIDNLMIIITKFAAILSSLILQLGCKYTLAIYLFVSFKNTELKLAKKQYLGLDQQIISMLKIQNFILSIKPILKVQSKNQQKNSFMINFFTSTTYYNIKVAISLISIIPFCFVSPTLQLHFRVFLVGCILCLGLIQLTLLICQFFFTPFNISVFLVDLVCVMIAISGCFIMYVPPLQFSYDSYTLKSFLLVYSGLNLLRIYSSLRFAQKCKKWIIRIIQTIKNLGGLIFFAVSFVLVFALIFQDRFKMQKNFQNFGYSLNAAIIGLSGSGLSTFLFQNKYSPELEGWKITLYFCCCAYSLLLKNLFIGEILYRMNRSNKTQLDIFKRKMQGFEEVWKLLDPKGLGLIEPKTLLFHLKKILPFFSISSLNSSKYEYRQQIIKELKLKVYQYSSNNESSSSRYVFLMHDVIYNLFQLSKFGKDFLTRQDLLQKWKQRSLQLAPKGLVDSNLNSRQVLNIMPIAKKIVKKHLIKRI